ncbi:MAG TPA: TerB family tellurite resistance protein [Polyangiaceae bacterium]|jgi:uncharacterized tellurite resistance protein B-like protein
MFGRWLKRASESPALEGAAELEREVAAHMSGADAESIRVVTAMAGLLGAVAYADRNYSQDEEHRVRAELDRVQGLPSRGVEAVCAVLREHVLELSTVQIPRYCRLLRELGDRELRLEVLASLVDLAAADGSISSAETNLLRQVTTALGLDQGDYNAAQARHRESLDVLRSPE